MACEMECFSSSMSLKCKSIVFSVLSICICLCRELQIRGITDVVNKEKLDEFCYILIFSVLCVYNLDPFLLRGLFLLSQHAAQGASLLQSLPVRGPLSAGWSFTPQEAPV